MKYSTKYIDGVLKYRQHKRDMEHRGLCESGVDFMLGLLDRNIQGQEYERIMTTLSSLSTYYSYQANDHLQLDNDPQKAKESYYLAALAGELIYTMAAKGFPHQMLDGGRPFDFKKKNFVFTQRAVLCSEYELALRIAGKNTLEGALILQDYERACSLLPKNPDDGDMCEDKLQQCMWAAAHGDQKAFDKYMKYEIKSLRYYTRDDAVTVDTMALAIAKLAKRRGMSCGLNVIELPLELLDETRIDTSGLSLPLADKVTSVLNDEKAWRKKYDIGTVFYL